jgi:hypothetical protein
MFLAANIFALTKQSAPVCFVMPNQLFLVPPLFQTFLAEFLPHKWKRKNFLPTLGTELQIIQSLA